MPQKRCVHGGLRLLENSAKMILISPNWLTALHHAKLLPQIVSFQPVEVPCSATLPTSCPTGLRGRTVANGINSRGTSSGSSRMELRKQHGFLFSGGTITTIDSWRVATSVMELVRSGGYCSGTTRQYIPGLAIRLPRIASLLPGGWFSS